MPYYPADMHLPYVCAAIRPLPGSKYCGHESEDGELHYTTGYTTLIRGRTPTLFVLPGAQGMDTVGYTRRVTFSRLRVTRRVAFSPDTVLDHRLRSLAGLTWSISSPCPRHRNRDPGCHSKHTSDFRLIDIYTGFDVRDFHHRSIFLSVIACRLPKLPVKPAKSHRL